MEVDEVNTDLQRHKQLVATQIAAVKIDVAVFKKGQEQTEARLEGIEKNLGWVVKLIIGGFVTAAVAFALRGGLNAL